MVLQNALSGQPLTYVFDLDGVVYRGKELQPHAVETIDALKKLGHNVRFFTNNAAQTRTTYYKRLESMGIPTPVEHIMTSAYAAALYFEERNAKGKTALRIGEEGITVELEAVGMNVITDSSLHGSNIDYVVAGLDRNFDYDKLAQAQSAILGGAVFVATNEDATYPVEGGRLMPGAGALVAAIRTATSVEPIVIGKPEAYALGKIVERAGGTPERTIMVGDRLDTDIAAGNRYGATTALALTGVTTREEAQKAVGELKPNIIICDLSELLN